MVEFVKVQKLKYIGNKQTNKYKNNVQFYVSPYFDDKDTLSIVDMKDKRTTSNVPVYKMSVGEYVYFRVFHAIFSKHTDQYCLLYNISKAIKQNIIKNSVGKLDKYILTSNDENKEPLLMVILNSKYWESVNYE